MNEHLIVDLIRSLNGLKGIICEKKASSQYLFLIFSKKPLKVQTMFRRAPDLKKLRAPKSPLIC